MFVGVTGFVGGSAFGGTAVLAVNPCVSGGAVTHWVGGSGDWDTAAKWDNGVPNSTTTACITASGTYVVTVGITGGEAAKALELGGVSGTQTLQIFGQPFNHHGLLTLANQDPALGVEAHGVIVLAETHSVNNVPEPTEGNIKTTSGTLTNRGSIVSANVATGPNSIAGNLDNQGLLQLNETLISPFAATWTTSGNVTIAAGKEVDLNWGPSGSFTQLAGTFANGGVFDQTGGVFLAAGSGTETGNPLQFDGQVTISPSGTGSGSFEMRSGSDILGSDIAAGYTVRVAGRVSNHNGGLTVPVSRTNHGTIRLGSVDGTSGTLTVAAGATLTNTNTIVSDVNNNSSNVDHISGTLDNQGNLQFDENTTSNFASTWTSSGSISVGAGKEVDLNWTAGGASFSQTAGTFVNNGVFLQAGGVFLATGTGSETGNALQFDGHVTISPSGTGTGTFDVRSGNDTLGSDIGAGYIVKVGGRPQNHHGALIVPVARTNNGTIALGGGDGTQGTLQIDSAALINKGSIVSGYTDVSQTNNGPNHLLGPINNLGQITALVNDIDRSGAIVNSGTITVGANRSMSFASLTQSGGVTNIAQGGTLSTDSGTVTLQGGMLSGDGTVHASVANGGGTVHPGHSPGTLTVQGNYVQTAGDLAIDVAGTAAGTGYSQLAVTGNASLAGTLHVTTSAPQTASLQILTANAVTGQFATATFAGQTDTITYHTNDVTLNAIASVTPPPAPPFTALVPARLLETRSGAGFSTVDGQYLGSGVQAGGSVVALTVAGRAGIPADASAVVLNVTVTDPAAAGFVTVFPCGAAQPTASNLNFVAGTTIPNAVITKIGDGGKVCLYTSQATQLIVDANGYFP